MTNILPLYQPGKTRADDEQFASFVYETYTRFFYQRFTYRGQFVPAIGRNPLTTKIQLSGSDVAGISPSTKETVYFEEKADTHQPINCFLERYSNTVKVPPIDSWLKTSEATYLLYSYYWLPKAIGKHVLDTFLWDFKKVQGWFFLKEYSQSLGKLHIQRDTPNQTGGYIVPLKNIIPDVHPRRYLIMPVVDSEPIIERVEPLHTIDEIKAIALELSPSSGKQVRSGIA